MKPFSVAALTVTRQRKLAWLVGAVAVPALLLASVASMLTLRVGRQVQADGARYNAYLAAKVSEAFELELLAQLRDAVIPAENVAQAGGGPETIVAALATRSRQFEAPHFVSVEGMDDLSMLMVESNMLLFGEDVARTITELARTKTRPPMDATDILDALGRAGLAAFPEMIRPSL